MSTYTVLSTPENPAISRHEALRVCSGGLHSNFERFAGVEVDIPLREGNDDAGLLKSCYANAN